MPTVEFETADFTDGKIGLLRAMVKAGMAASNGEARRTVEQGGVSVDDEKITDTAFAFTNERLSAGVVVKKGKKCIMKFITK